MIERTLQVLAVAIVAIGLPRLAAGDELRNVKIGEAVPAFSVSTLGGEQLALADLRGKVVLLLYLSAQQRSSEQALADAVALDIGLSKDDFALVTMTADVVEVAEFRALRDRLAVHAPLGLDVARRVYGQLGLVVTPTSIVIDREGRLAHVISSRRSDYPQVINAFVRHALGEYDDAELRRRLTAESFEVDPIQETVARHRATARILRERGLLADAERELRQALDVDPAHAAALLDLASIDVAMERYDDAQAVLTRAVAAGAGPRRAALLQGAVYYHHGRLAEAKTTLEQASVVNPDPVWLHYYLGRIAEDEGDTTEAARHYRLSLDRAVSVRDM